MMACNSHSLNVADFVERVVACVTGFNNFAYLIEKLAMDVASLREPSVLFILHDLFFERKCAVARA